MAVHLRQLPPMPLLLPLLLLPQVQPVLCHSTRPLLCRRRRRKSQRQSPAGGSRAGDTGQGQIFSLLPGQGGAWPGGGGSLELWPEPWGGAPAGQGSKRPAAELSSIPLDPGPDTQCQRAGESDTLPPGSRWARPPPPPPPGAPRPAAPCRARHAAPAVPPAPPPPALRAPPPRPPRRGRPLPAAQRKRRPPTAAPPAAGAAAAAARAGRPGGKTSRCKNRSAFVCSRGAQARDSRPTPSASACTWNTNR